MEARLWSLYLSLFATITALALPFIQNPIFGIAVWLLILASVAYSTEITIAIYEVRVWYNVMVVSALAALPQAVSAVNLALNGHIEAAWIDTLYSTIVDAIFVTGIVRRSIVGSDVMRSLVPSMVLWSIAALFVDYYAHSGVQSSVISWGLVVLGYVLLPMLIVFNLGERAGGLPPASVLVNAALNTVAMVISTWYLMEDIYALELSAAQLGIASAFITALPDLLSAFMIRSIYAKFVSSEGGDAEAAATMLASAVHDQISVPAVIILLASGAGSLYPTWLNIYAILAKFSLLSRRAYLVTLATSLVILALALGFKPF